MCQDLKVYFCKKCIRAQLKLAFYGNRWPSSHLRFSELNSDSRNLRNCSLPTGSFKTSSMPNAHLLTLCWLGSLLLNTQEHNFDGQPMHGIFRLSPVNMSIYIINVETLLQAPRLWCHLRSMGWMGQEVWGKGRIPSTAPCTPANCAETPVKTPQGCKSYNNLNIWVTVQQYFKEEGDRAPVCATSPFRRGQQGFSLRVIYGGTDA